MAVGLYMDEHLPGPITDNLRTRGVDVIRAQDDVPEGPPDPALLSRATERGRLLVSFDDDLLAETTRRLRTEEPFTGIVYAHPQSVPVGPCVRDLELVAKTFEPGDLRGRVVYLPL